MKSKRFMAAVEAYVAARNRLGFALRIESKQLRDFARYADSIGHCESLTTALAVSWATLPGRRPRRFPERRLQVIRPFARYLAAIDEANEVPPRDLLGRARQRPLHHIYTDEQILALLGEAAKLRPSSLQGLTYATILGLLAASGLRISEALRLLRADVELNSRVLVIRETKFRKSRLVPIHTTTAQALRHYAEVRDEKFPPQREAPFFVGDGGGALAYSTVNHVFGRMRTALGWNEFVPRPRIHDLRHTFACHRLRDWYAEGLDVAAKVASLATYLGHAHVTDTYWYLTGTPELLALAANRFETRAIASGRAGGKQ
jgi:integrase